MRGNRVAPVIEQLDREFWHVFTLCFGVLVP